MWWLGLRKTTVMVVRFEVEDDRRQWWVGPVVVVVAGEEKKKRKEDEKVDECVGQNYPLFFLVQQNCPFLINKKMPPERVYKGICHIEMLMYHCSVKN